MVVQLDAHFLRSCWESECHLLYSALAGAGAAEVRAPLAELGSVGSVGGFELFDVRWPVVSGLCYVLVRPPGARQYLGHCVGDALDRRSVLNTGGGASLLPSANDAHFVGVHLVGLGGVYDADPGVVG
jgi:hypothetical protein